MEWLELPSRPEGTVEERIEQLWDDLFRLVERLNAQNGEAAAGERRSE